MKLSTLLLVVAVSIALLLCLPAVALTASGQADKLPYYVQALEHLFKGLVEYFKAVVELFKAAVGAG